MTYSSAVAETDNQVDLSDGSSMLALGTQYGIWIGPRDGVSHEFQLAVAQEDCRQLAILDNTALVVRTKRSALMAYDIQQVSVAGSHHRWGYIHRSSVISFAVGTIYNTRVLCYLIQKRSCTLLVIMQYKGEWFRKAKEYRLESRDTYHVQVAYDAVFLQSPSLGIGRIHNGRCEWKKVTTFPGNVIGFVPFSRDSGYAYDLHTAWNICFYDNTNPVSIQHKVDFDARLQKLVIISPYLIGFSPSVIEVRHMETVSLITFTYAAYRVFIYDIQGETVQVLAGNHIKCVHTSYDDDLQRPIIHVSILHHEDHIVRIYSLFAQ